MFKLKYFWPYLLFFFSIAILVWLNVDMINRHVNKNAAFAHTIHMAEQQATLSEQLVKECYQLYIAAANTHGRISTELEMWNEVHYDLQKNGKRFNLHAIDFKGIDNIYGQLNPVQQQLYADIRLAVNEGLTDARMKRIAQHQEKYLPLMEAVTNGIEKQANIEMTAIKVNQAWLALISGLLLVLEMAVFIYPYHKRLVSSFKKLKEQREEIDVQAEQLHKMNETQDLIIKGIKAGIWEWDVLTGEEIWSAHFFEILGYTPGEIPANYDYFFNKLLHPEDREMIGKALKAHLEHGVPYAANIRMLCKDGSYRWYEAAGQAMWDTNGKPLRMAGSLIDIDQSITYRNQMEHNGFLLEEAGKMAKMGSFEMDAKTGKSHWSANMYDINEVPYGDESVLLKPYTERYPKEFHAIIENITDRALNHGEPFDVELQLITAKGNLKWVRSIGTPVKDADGKVVQLRGVYQDINDRKIKELELLNTKDELEEVSRTKDKLFSIVAHDLRGPLAGLTALVELQSDNLITQEEYSELTEHIKVSLNNLSSTLDNLLHWAQSQMDGMVTQHGRIRVNDCVREAVNLYANAIALKKIDIQQNSNEEVFALADNDQVFLIIRNLVNNAIKFTPDGGKIVIDLTEQNGNACIRVSDNGIGMSYGTLQIIKDNQYLFSTQGTMGEKGSGLGLNLCLEMAAKNGGSIDVQSEQGKGSSFTLVLPSAQKAA